MNKRISFDKLVTSIIDINTKAGNFAKSAVNQLLTVRNWVIGYYIVEYEQNGKDRAKYGTNLLVNLEKSINKKGLNLTLFKLCRQFYLKYPQIGSTLSNQFDLINIVKKEKSSTLSNKTINTYKNGSIIDSKQDNANNKICNTQPHKFTTAPELLLSRLSFSHIREIMAIEDQQ